jgi:response regulator RpfG family c-di-GMP phosphodiesterase
VAKLAATAAEPLGCSHAEVSEVRAAGFLHDVGRVAVPNGIWDKPGPSSAGERERVRLHPYHTERVLERSGALAPLALLDVMPDAAAFATIDSPHCWWRHPNPA